jgi:hypothetical protein
MSAPTIQTIKKLFALSGNRCAFPGCSESVIENTGTLIAEICHINAQSPQGPRYNENLTEDQRNSFENLILLCGSHHKIVDENVTKYDASALKEMKKNHEGKHNYLNIEECSFIARRLLKEYEHLQIVNNSGFVAINSPGAIQGQTINIRPLKKNALIITTPGSIGSDVRYSGYIQHLIARYNEFAGSDHLQKRKFSYGAISKNLADNFGTNWKLLPLEKASAVIEYLQGRILRTRQGRINTGRRWKSFTLFNDFVAKYGK